MEDKKVEYINVKPYERKKKDGSITTVGGYSYPKSLLVTAAVGLGATGLALATLSKKRKIISDGLSSTEEQIKKLAPSPNPKVVIPEKPPSYMVPPKSGSAKDIAVKSNYGIGQSTIPPYKEIILKDANPDKRYYKVDKEVRQVNSIVLPKKSRVPGVYRLRASESKKDKYHSVYSGLYLLYDFGNN